MARRKGIRPPGLPKLRYRDPFHAEKWGRHFARVTRELLRGVFD